MGSAYKERMHFNGFLYVARVLIKEESKINILSDL